MDNLLSSCDCCHANYFLSNTFFSLPSLLTFNWSVIVSHNGGCVQFSMLIMLKCSELVWSFGVIIAVCGLIWIIRTNKTNHCMESARSSQITSTSGCCRISKRHIISCVERQHFSKLKVLKCLYRGCTAAAMAPGHPVGLGFLLKCQQRKEEKKKTQEVRQEAQTYSGPSTDQHAAAQRPRGEGDH